MKSSTIKLGLILAATTTILFLCVYFWFLNNAQFSNVNYLRTSAFMISFVLPFLYTGFGFYHLYTCAKTSPLKFRQAFQLSFYPLLIGGLLSASFIFAFFNTTGSWAETELELALIEVFDENLEHVDAHQKKQWQQSKQMIEDKGVNLFSIGNYLQFLSVLVFFYLLISAILAMFLKNRKL